MALVTNILFPAMFLLFGITALALSMSKKNFSKLVENNGEKFALQLNKILRIGGVFLLICSVVWVIVAIVEM